MFKNFMDFWKICIIMLYMRCELRREEWYCEGHGKNQALLSKPKRAKNIIRLRDIHTTKRQYLGNCWKAIKLMLWDGDVFIESFRNVIYLRTFLNQERTLELADLYTPLYDHFGMRSSGYPDEYKEIEKSAKRSVNNNGQDNQQ